MARVLQFRCKTFTTRRCANPTKGLDKSRLWLSKCAHVQCVGPGELVIRAQKPAPRWTMMNVSSLRPSSRFHFWLAALQPCKRLESLWNFAKFAQGKNTRSFDRRHCLPIRRCILSHELSPKPYSSWLRSVKIQLTTRRKKTNNTRKNEQCNEEKTNSASELFVRYKIGGQNLL